VRGKDHDSAANLNIHSCAVEGLSDEAILFRQSAAERPDYQSIDAELGWASGPWKSTLEKLAADSTLLRYRF
jgi:hypothetical protein